MNATRRDPQSQPKTTQTFFPTPRPAASASPVSAQPTPSRKEDDHAPEEPGYGHGV
jgi:hypothetical protein